MSVSESVCIFVPQLLRNGEPQRAETLRDDFPWDKEGYRLKNIRIRRAVSRKIKKNYNVSSVHSMITLPLINNFFPFVNYTPYLA